MALAKDYNSVFEFVGLDPKFGYVISTSLMQEFVGLTKLVPHCLDSVTFLDSLIRDSVDPASFWF